LRNSFSGILSCVNESYWNLYEIEDKVVEENRKLVKRNSGDFDKDPLRSEGTFVWETFSQESYHALMKATGTFMK